MEGGGTLGKVTVRRVRFPSNPVRYTRPTWPWAHFVPRHAHHGSVGSCGSSPTSGEHDVWGVELPYSQVSQALGPPLALQHPKTPMRVPCQR